jgi:hypothetical protein
VRVVYDETLLVAATAFAGDTWSHWPEVPPYTRHPEQDALGIVASSRTYNQDVSLVLSRGLLYRVQRSLAEDVGLLQRDIDDYLMALMNLARTSGGGIEDDPIEPPTGNPGHVEVALQLARSQAAETLLVASHPDVLKLGPLWASEVHVLSADEFARRVDAARRPG